MSKTPDYDVVWSGRDSLLPDRETQHDPRLDLMPSYDLDDGEHEERRPKRKYTRTGRYSSNLDKPLKDGDTNDRTAASGPDSGPDIHQ